MIQFNAQSFVTLALVMLFIGAGNYVIQLLGKWHDAQGKGGKLFDIGHALFPNLHQHEWAINVLPIALLFFAAVQANAGTVLKQFFLMLLVVMVIRVLVMFSTILPKQDHCTTPTSFLEIVVNGGCYDKLYSGHISVVTLLSLLLAKHHDLGWPAVAALVGTEGLLLVATRAHYTVDVLLGFLISYLIYDGNYSIFKTFFKGL